MKKRHLFLILSLGCILVISGCKGKNSKTDLSSSHTVPATETMSATGAKTSESQEPVSTKDGEQETAKEESADNNKGNSSAASSVSASLSSYKEGNITIEYPVISNLNDASVEEKVNSLLKDNALSVIKAYSADPEKDSLSVKCKIISADRKKITAVYTGLYTLDGGAHPTNLFFSNTVDTAMAENVRLTDYADPYTLAGYVLSGDCQFYDAGPELTKELLSARLEQTIEEYTEQFRQADFPLKNGKTEEGLLFPESFSYEDQGTIFVSIPVNHALGDYALISYTPETK